MKELAKRSTDKRAEKAFIDHQVDDVRLPYKRLNVKIARRCIFIATTNESQILTDSTGSRRFWIVEAGINFKNPKQTRIDTNALADASESLWAEAMICYQKHKTGCTDQDYTWWLNDKEEILHADSSLDYTQVHPLTSAVLDAIEEIHGVITVAKIIEELFKEKNILKETTKYLEKSTRMNQIIISDILTANGYKYKRQYVGVGQNRKQKRGWFK